MGGWGTIHHMTPFLIAQAAVDMATPFTLAVVVLIAGGAATVGAMQMQISSLKDVVREHGNRLDKRDEHASGVDKQLAAMSSTLARVDTRVEKITEILTAERRSS